jgi:hypothetical protein
MKLYVFAEGKVYQALPSTSWPALKPRYKRGCRNKAAKAAWERPTGKYYTKEKEDSKQFTSRHFVKTTFSTLTFQVSCK